MASPPKVVTISACIPAARLAPLRGVVADQQVGEDRGQLPEHVEHEQVVGEDQTQHRAGEGDEVARERGEAGLVVGEVPGAVEQHQRADPGDDQHHHPLQRSHRERQVEPQRRHPADHLGRAPRRRRPDRSRPAPTRTPPREPAPGAGTPVARDAGPAPARRPRPRSARARGRASGRPPAVERSRTGLRTPYARMPCARTPAEGRRSGTGGLLARLVGVAAAERQADVDQARRGRAPR